ncbi:CRISPR-associated protein Cas2 [Staphylococcus pseudintermedius]|uniref:CRISPR-associated endonuclease Cas2 n=1 Tax=Staphylococcus pseudintermedius TaxID=283734 RepID=UPI000CDF0EBA|nr:CRISPR-associated endonuclease Cas2 [Staphylococcus pseudintermedius]EGQ1672941.1 CRISPR-associated protein Cas2 [Staphylococcus pseudintermedius]EGQ3221898.1 CRISPR-associated protein Cas2 [Staphylococcus pseudintermedius]EGQ3994468.1 CRISPR-associated protein Cas2 [Staphylococcus pseudintermedius]EII6318695.1 CRISPR-associated protein Cas2 [Staphylococcus pseudintermedius]EJA1962381.1 CRISPR-associated protein Cas2 [Staphylococcus pseudintermedius]
MKSYIISYDLNDRKDYPKLISRIEDYPNAAKINKSVWFVNSVLSAKEIRNELKFFVDNDDSLFVATLTGEAAWSNVICDSKHLKDYL